MTHHIQQLSYIPGSSETFPLSLSIFSVSCFFSSSSCPISDRRSPGRRSFVLIWSTRLWVALNSVCIRSMHRPTTRNKNTCRGWLCSLTKHGEACQACCGGEHFGVSRKRGVDVPMVTREVVKRNSVYCRL